MTSITEDINVITTNDTKSKSINTNDQTTIVALPCESDSSCHQNNDELSVTTTDNTVCLLGDIIYSCEQTCLFNIVKYEKIVQPSQKPTSILSLRQNIKHVKDCITGRLTSTKIISIPEPKYKLVYKAYLPDFDTKCYFKDKEILHNLSKFPYPIFREIYISQLLKKVQNAIDKETKSAVFLTPCLLFDTQFVQTTVCDSDNASSVAISDDIEQIGTCGMVMRKFDMNLYEFVDELSMYELQYVIFQMILSVYTLHKLNILHADIKPTNFIINKSNLHVSLIDFNISKILNKSNFVDYVESYYSYEFDSLPTDAKQYRFYSFYEKLIYTTGYRAPEVQNEETYALSADCYALGVTIRQIIHRTYTRHIDIKSQPIEIQDKLVELNKIVSELTCSNPSNRKSAEEAVRHLMRTMDFDTAHSYQISDKLHINNVGQLFEMTNFGLTWYKSSDKLMHVLSQDLTYQNVKTLIDNLLIREKSSKFAIIAPLLQGLGVIKYTYISNENGAFLRKCGLVKYTDIPLTEGSLPRFTTFVYTRNDDLWLKDQDLTEKVFKYDFDSDFMIHLTTQMLMSILVALKNYSTEKQRNVTDTELNSIVFIAIQLFSIQYQDHYIYTLIPSNIDVNTEILPLIKYFI